MKRMRGSLADEFLSEHFEDVRRGRRFRRMVGGLAVRPNGKVSEVFRSAAERQGAYDFLEHEGVSSEDVQRAATKAVARRCAQLETVYVALDGSSLTLTDQGESKGFGSIGTRSQGARGLKVLNALALGPQGQTIGAIAQSFWVRESATKKGYRPLEKRESHRWHQALGESQRALAESAPHARIHVLADREGDASALMQRIVGDGCDFTIRANGTRKINQGGHRTNLRHHLRLQKPIASYSVAVPEKVGRPARIARLTVRSVRITMVMRDHLVQKRRELPLTVVWAREEGPSAPAAGLDWLLYTTIEATTARDAIDAISRYAYRWRIEDFHRVLKTGGGCVEDSQLRSPSAVIKWATLHSIVASRALRLRDAARATPDLVATAELSDDEIKALVILKNEEKRRTETISADKLTIKQAVRWIADLGGFTATGVSKTPPGATVIERGLERVLDAAQLLAALRAAGRLR